MFGHLLKKSTNTVPKREASESTAPHTSKGSEETANRSNESPTVTPSATVKQAPGLEKSPFLGSSVLLHRSNSSSHKNIFASFEILGSDASSGQKMQAANALANLTLRCELLPRFQEPEFLNQLVSAMRCTQDECAKRFVYMALVRLVGHKEMVRPCLDHPDLLTTTVDAASQQSGSSWRQAARALAIIATKCRGCENFQKLSLLKVLPPIARLLDLDQTEFRTDAICAFASWTTTRENVQLLTANGVWGPVLKACVPPPPPQQAVVTVGMNLMIEAAKTGPDALDLSPDAFAALCELCAGSELPRPIDSVLCAVMVSCAPECVPTYAALGASQRLAHLAGCEGDIALHAGSALGRIAPL